MIRPPEKIETRRLILRRPVLGDAEEVFREWAQDGEVTNAKESLHLRSEALVNLPSAVVGSYSCSNTTDDGFDPS